MADEADGMLSQDDINNALESAGLEGAEAAPADEAPSPPADSGSVSQDAINEALAEASAAVGEETTAQEPDQRVDSAGRPFDEVAAAMAVAIESESAIGGAAESPAPLPAGAARFDLPELGDAGGGTPADVQGIDLLRDVDLNVKIELGRSRMLVDDVLRLGEGSVVELDKLAGDPVDVFVNDRLVARGEVLVLNDNFCVRINDILSREFEAEGS